MNFIRPAVQAAQQRDVHPSHHQAHVKPVNAPLHVVVGLSNPLRYRSRYELYRAFRKYVADSGAILTTVELALGDRHHEVTDHHNPRDLQLRSPSVLWHKENLVNLGLRHLSVTDPDWQYAAWIDSDVTFSRPDWAAEAVHLLQTYSLIQMWSHSIDLGPASQPISNCTSFLQNWQQNEALLQPWSRAQGKAIRAPSFQLGLAADTGSHVHPTHPPHPGGHEPGLLHTGYAYAATRDTLDALGGLGDIGILGSGDRHMAYALIGEVDKSFPTGIHESYRDYWREWQYRAEQHVRRNVGVMQATLMHNWHGSKLHRRYQDRWKILTAEPKFNWQRDLRHDSQGVLGWTHNNPRLERQVRQYFSVRSEDSIDL